MNGFLCFPFFFFSWFPLFFGFFNVFPFQVHSENQMKLQEQYMNPTAKEKFSSYKTDSVLWWTAGTSKQWQSQKFQENRKNIKYQIHYYKVTPIRRRNKILTDFFFPEPSFSWKKKNAATWFWTWGLPYSNSPIY